MTSFRRMSLGMNGRQVGQLGQRRVPVVKVQIRRLGQGVQHRGKALRAFRMTDPRPVIQHSGVGEQSDGHGRLPH